MEKIESCCSSVHTILADILRVPFFRLHVSSSRDFQLFFSGPRERSQLVACRQRFPNRRTSPQIRSIPPRDLWRGAEFSRDMNHQHREQSISIFFESKRGLCYFQHQVGTKFVLLRRSCVCTYIAVVDALSLSLKRDL